VSASEFDWTLEHVDDYTLKIKVNYTDPSSISATSFGKDMMKIMFV